VWSERSASHASGLSIATHAWKYILRTRYCVRYHRKQTRELAGRSSVDTLLRAFAGLPILARFKGVPYEPTAIVLILSHFSRFYVS